MKRTAALLLATLFLFQIQFPAFGAEKEAGFCPAQSLSSGRAGDVVEVSLPYDGTLGAIGGFFTEVTYDPEVFTYLRTNSAPVLQKGYTTTLESGGTIRSAYSVKDRENYLEDPGETFTYRFRIRENAQAGESPIYASVYEIADLQPQHLGRDVDQTLLFTVLPPPSSDSSLQHLAPDSGELVPSFESGIVHYTVDVPFETKTMTFTAEAAEGAYCRVNRKNLGAGGSSTLFQLTVTAEDEKSETVYQVSVHRGERGTASATEKPSPVPKPTKTPAPEKTPKPTATPKPVMSKSVGTEKTPKPTKSPGLKNAEVNSESPAGSPLPAAARKTAMPASYSLTINNGNTSYVPGLIAVILLVLAILGADPLSRWLCKRFPEKDSSEENEEGDKK